uniref:Uncharacterized protein n=1 Tax=Romanomermis culicivorax TaxID=13658 RepID=A0A915IH53_ROMCU
MKIEKKECHSLHNLFDKSPRIERTMACYSAQKTVQNLFFSTFDPSTDNTFATKKKKVADHYWRRLGNKR